MIILLQIYKMILKISYFFLKLQPINNKQILLLSRQSDTPSVDFKYIIKDLNDRYPDRKIVVLTKRMAKDNPIQIFKYIFFSFKQMYYLSTSKVCIIDGYQITISCLKHKKGLKIIQIWHSLGAIKKFGYQSLNTKRDKKIAKVMNMHKNYDYIIAGSKETIKNYSKSFNYSPEHFILNNLPRVEYLQQQKNKKKNKVYKLYPELKNKKVVLYVPTFRAYDDYRFEELIKEFENSKYTLIIKKHARINVDIPKKYIFEDATSLELLTVCDYVITDYSAISIEAAIMDKPVLLYAYDYDKYYKSTGLNMNLKKEFKDYIFNNAADLCDFIENGNYNMQIIKDFKNKHITESKESATKTLVDFIIKESL